MDGLDKALEKIVAGKFDMASEKKRASAQDKLSEYVQLTISGENPEQAAKLEAELIALEAEFGNIMNGEKFDPADLKKRVAFGQKVMKYQQALVAGKDEAAIAELEKELEAEAPKDFDFKEFKENIKKAMVQRKESMEIQRLFTSYAKAVGENGDAAKAAELAKELAALKTTNAEILNGIAWTILTDEDIKQRDTKLALDLARRAVEATEGKSAGTLDTYARALFETGDKAGAIAQQKKALELAEDDEEKAEMQAALTKYEAASKAK
jgi:tetratricopeptide (TPR) repeat protein